MMRPAWLRVSTESTRPYFATISSWLEREGSMLMMIALPSGLFGRPDDRVS
jgi:hypothetical protein